MVDSTLRKVLEGRINIAAKKLISAVGQWATANGALPDELQELDVARSLGWTLTQLDDQDMSRVLPGLSLANTRDALSRIMNYLHTHGKHKPTENDWQIWGWVQEQMKDG